MPKKKTTQKTKETLRRRERMREALHYRKNGYNYREIAAAMRISIATAHTYVTEALKEITRESAEQVLALHLERYDALLTTYFDKAMEGDGFAADKVLAIMGKIERLHGVEAPREADQTTETYNALSQLLHAAKEQQTN